MTLKFCRWRFLENDSCWNPSRWLCEMIGRATAEIIFQIEFPRNCLEWEGAALQRTMACSIVCCVSEQFQNIIDYPLRNILMSFELWFLIGIMMSEWQIFCFGNKKSPFILIRYIAMINCLLRFTLKRTKETGKPKHVLFRSYKAIQACLIGRFHLDSTVT